MLRLPPFYLMTIGYCHGLTVGEVEGVSPNVVCVVENGTKKDYKEFDVGGRLRLTQFNVDRILSHGATLLGSQGAEYDIPEAIGKAHSAHF